MADEKETQEISIKGEGNMPEAPAIVTEQGPGPVDGSDKAAPDEFLPAEGVAIEDEPYGTVRHEAIKHPDEHNIAHRGAALAGMRNPSEEAQKKIDGNSTVRAKAIRSEDYTIGNVRGKVVRDRVYDLPANVFAALYASGAVEEALDWKPPKKEPKKDVDNG